MEDKMLLELFGCCLIGVVTGIGLPLFLIWLDS